MKILRIEAHIKKPSAFNENQLQIKPVAKISGENQEIRDLLGIFGDPFVSKMEIESGITVKTNIFDNISSIKVDDDQYAVINGVTLPSRYIEEIEIIREKLSKIDAHEISLHIRRIDQ